MASTARHFLWTKKSIVNGRSRGRGGCGIEARTAGQTGAGRWLDHSGLSASSISSGRLKNKALAVYSVTQGLITIATIFPSRPVYTHNIYTTSSSKTSQLQSMGSVLVKLMNILVLKYSLLVYSICTSFVTIISIIFFALIKTIYTGLIRRQTSIIRQYIVNF